MGWQQGSIRGFSSRLGPLVQAVGVVALRRLWSGDIAHPGEPSHLRREGRGCDRSQWMRSRPNRHGGWPRGCRTVH